MNKDLFIAKKQTPKDIAIVAIEKAMGHEISSSNAIEKYIKDVFYVNLLRAFNNPKNFVTGTGTKPEDNKDTK